MRNELLSDTFFQARIHQNKIIDKFSAFLDEYRKFNCVLLHFHLSLTEREKTLEFT